MAKKITVGETSGHKREIDLGSLRYLVEKYRNEDVQFVVYKLSYAGKFIFIKGKTLAGSLIILTDTLNSFSEGNDDRFRGHLYTHLYNHFLDHPGGRFRVKIIATAGRDQDFYSLLKQEQMALDEFRYSADCLNNQLEAYIPQWSEKTASYGWIPKTAVMNFKRWLDSEERAAHAAQYKK